MIKLLLLKIAILQLQLQLLMLPPVMTLGATGDLSSTYLTKYNTSTSTADTYFQTNPSYEPIFPIVDPSQPDYVDKIYSRNDATGKVIDETHKYFYYLDPNTKIKYTKRISTNPAENYDFK